MSGSILNAQIKGKALFKAIKQIDECAYGMEELGLHTILKIFQKAVAGMVFKAAAEQGIDEMCLEGTELRITITFTCKDVDEFEVKAQHQCCEKCTKEMKQNVA